jgi:uncharacterized protein (DUF427 family)
MSVRVRELLMGRLGELRHEPIQPRIRARLGERTVVDSTRALLVWEPRRIVPEYAVPEADVDGELVPAPAAAAVAEDELPRLGDRPVLDPSIPFAVHTAPGEPLALRAGDREAGAFRPDDEALAGHVVLAFRDFDAWYAEDEPTVAHPRDPFHRIDVSPSARSVRVELDGEVLAESASPRLLFEPPLPVRFYLDPADVDTGRLRASDTVTWCAYKGRASYLATPDGRDVAWFYPEPLHDAEGVRGRIAFFNERVDLVVDGVAQERPVTPWSR